MSACFFSSLPPSRTWEQLGGACLLGIGIWVMVDPTGFREIVAANPLLITGAYILLAMGGLLFLLGFLGCCGAVRENKCLLLFVSMPPPPPPMGAVEHEAPVPTVQETHTEVRAKSAPPTLPMCTWGPSFRSPLFALGPGLSRGQAAPRWTVDLAFRSEQEKLLQGMVN